MPVLVDLHGKMTVQLPVPLDARKTLGMKKLSRMVRVKDGETVESVTRDLQEQIDQAREPYPMKIVVDCLGRHDQASREKIEKAMVTLVEALELGSPMVSIHKARE